MVQSLCLYLSSQAVVSRQSSVSLPSSGSVGRSAFSPSPASKIGSAISTDILRRRCHRGAKQKTTGVQRERQGKMENQRVDFTRVSCRIQTYSMVFKVIVDGLCDEEVC